MKKGINFTAEESKNEWVSTCTDRTNRTMYLYKAVGLVGSNASGKSNILDSFNYAVKFINNSFTRKEDAHTDESRNKKAP